MYRKKKSNWMVMAGIAVVIVAAVAISLPTQAARKFVQIGTAGITGVYYLPQAELFAAWLIVGKKEARYYLQSRSDRRFRL